jgi:methylated-DNA-[protein]-cysteine S-methyltransferase
VVKETKPTIYWTLLAFEDWNIYIAATIKGLCFVGSLNNPFEELADWAETRFPGCQLVQNDEKLGAYKAEIIEYLQGKRQSFTTPMDYQGTSFQLNVWNALCEIPYGQTCSYSDIAHRIQKPAAVRAVGTAIGANPVLITVPCHRVIGKNGKLTGYRGGLDMKTQLLKIEQEGSTVKGGRHHV